MNTCVVHLWQNVAELLLEWEMLHTKLVEKIKTRDPRSSEILVAYVGTFFLTFRDNLSPVFKGEA